MNTKLIKTILYFIMSIFLFSCSNDQNENVIIFASSSLKTPLIKICNNYREETGKEIECLFNSSGKLREQIQKGDYADLYFSSSVNNINILKSIELLYNDSITNLLSNKIVLVMPKDLDIDINSFFDLTNDAVKKIAIGESMTSPLGRYTEEILNNLGIYNMITDKVILGKDAKDVIDLVKIDKIECGIVYKTEAILNDDDLKIAAEAQDGSYTEIIYGIAVLKNSLKERVSREFIDYLCSEKSLDILKDYGFDIII